MYVLPVLLHFLAYTNPETFSSKERFRVSP